jgi:hypothetical protein
MCGDIIFKAKNMPINTINPNGSDFKFGGGNFLTTFPTRNISFCRIITTTTKGHIWFTISKFSNSYFSFFFK